MKQQLYILTLILVGYISSAFGQDLFPYRQGTKWGFCDSTKKLVITPKYQSADIFSNCNISTIKLNDKYGFINKAGKEITSIKFDRWTFFWHCKTYVWLNNKVGVIDTNGKVIIPIIYDDISFTIGTIGVKQKDKWGLYNFKGKLIKKPTFQEVKTQSYVLTGIKLNDKWGFIDSNGRIKIKPIYDEIKGFSKEGFSAVRVKEKWGFVNLKGQLVIPTIYDEVNVFQEQGVWVKNSSKWGLLNSKGDIIIPFEFDEISYFKEGLSYVKKGDKYGFIDNIGKIIIPFKFYHAFEFSEGLAEVCYSEDSCGYINKQGSTVIPFQYTINFGGEFNDGLAEIKLGDNCGFIDKTGKTIVSPIYISPYDYNSFDNGVGMLLLPNEAANDKSKYEKFKFYFDRHGTLFYED